MMKSKIQIKIRINARAVARPTLNLNPNLNHLGRMFAMMRLSALFLCGFCLVVPSRIAAAEPEPLTFDVSVAPATVRRGQVFQVVIAGTLRDGYHTGTFSGSKPIWKLRPGSNDGLAVLSGARETPPPEDLNLVDGEKVHLGKFTWVQDILVLPEARPGPTDFTFKLRGTVCNEEGCFPKNPQFKVAVNVSTDPALIVAPEVTKRIVPPPDAPTPPVVPPASSQGTIAPPGSPAPAKQNAILNLISSSPDAYRADMDDLAKHIVVDNPNLYANSTADLLSFILAGVFWGAVSLVTPCVFPMIPITVSFFLKQSEKEHHRPISMALVYSATIVVVLTLAAAFMLSLFRQLSINPTMNYFLGALFVFFALSLFGMYEIELPSGLARFTSAREGKGGFLGTMFMALTFTIISFACVAPFLGGFGGTMAGNARPEWHNLLGGLAFSVTFAAPFFFLALFPTLLRQMPKSGSWLNSVKVIMGFLELAAAVKFFRLAEIKLTGAEPWLFTFDVALCIYVALCVLGGLYLLGLYRLPHDTPSPPPLAPGAGVRGEEHLGVLRMVFAGLFLALGLYLAPALIKNAHDDNLRPRGAVFAWIESFLLPDGSDFEQKSANLPATVAQAREEFKTTGRPRRIFVDFTDGTCTNCKINERSVFSKKDMRELFEPYLIVQLYTGTVPRAFYIRDLRAGFGGSVGRQEDDADVNLAFQKKIFGTEQLPLYAILEPQLNDTIKVIGVYKEGRINDEAAFEKFLSTQR